jgi:hypothetical protein
MTIGLIISKINAFAHTRLRAAIIFPVPARTFAVA